MAKVTTTTHTLRIPKEIVARASQTERGVYLVEIRDAEHRQVLDRLHSVGFRTVSEHDREIRLVREKRFGGFEVMVLIYCLLCFILPAIIYFAWWSGLPDATVILLVQPG